MSQPRPPFGLAATVPQALSRRPCTLSRSVAPATRSIPKSLLPGWTAVASALVADPREADAVMVNTCGFIEAAKKDSIDTLLAAS